ncbi:MAG TPA: DoxX family protein [Puia sp.]|nr:DoxX family protein [Puia sp.]
MKKTKVLYWVFTILFCGFMLFTAIGGISPSADSIKFMHGMLGYPVYFITFISIAKVLGVIALLVPGFPRLKEWAYAGFAFDLVGATYSVMSTGGGLSGAAFMLIIMLLEAASYIYYHKKRKDALVIPSSGF